MVPNNAKPSELAHFIQEITVHITHDREELKRDETKFKLVEEKLARAEKEVATLKAEEAHEQAEINRIKADLTHSQQEFAKMSQEMQKAGFKAAGHN